VVTPRPSQPARPACASTWRTSSLRGFALVRVARHLQRRVLGLQRLHQRAQLADGFGRLRLGLFAVHERFHGQLVAQLLVLFGQLRDGVLRLGQVVVVGRRNISRNNLRCFLRRRLRLRGGIGFHLGPFFWRRGDNRYHFGARMPERRAATPRSFGDLAVAPRAPFVDRQQRPARLALVRVGAAQAVRAVRAERVQERVTHGPLADLGRDRRLAGLLVRVVAVEAIGQPVVGAVMEHHHGRELDADLHRLGVVGHRFHVDLHARLRAAVDADRVEVQLFHHQRQTHPACFVEPCRQVQ
jgi:hypothetical protein